MTIEATLERIADALEAIAKNGASIGVDLASPGADKEAKPAAKAKSNGAAKQTVGKPKDEAATESPNGVTKDDVRAALQQLQKETTPAQAKSILKGLGASTLGNLDVAKYDLAIEECEKAMPGG